MSEFNRFYIDHENEQLKRDTERGYSLAELEEISIKLKQEQNEWTRHFDSYLDSVIHDDRSISPNEAVNRAASIADARQALLKIRFDQ